MADPTTVNRSYAIPTHGSDVNTWDVPLNGDFNLIDQNLGGVVSIATTGGGVTNLNAAQLACGTISVTGALSSSAGLIWPQIQGWWSVQNLTTGNVLFAVTAGGTEVVCFPPGEITDIQVNGPTIRYRNLGRVGSLLPYIGTVVPAWVTNCTIPPYLNCDGSTFSGSTYPYLATILGGTTLPDLRGRVRADLNQGTARITTGGSGIDGNTNLSAGGADNVTLTTPQIPAHAHGVTDPGHPHTVGPSSLTSVSYQSGATSTGNLQTTTATGSPAGQVAASNTTGISIQNTGGGGAHNNMGPTTIAGITMIRAG